MNSKGLTDKESITINIMKAAAILSVIAAHVVSVSDSDMFSYTISALWNLFGNTGVIVFFVIGGFLYTRKDGDTKAFWKKKFSRIILPWLCCSLITYTIAILLGRDAGIVSYLKWILGSNTWYYYLTVYTFFLFIFKWFYDKDIILVVLTVLQIIAIVMASFGQSTTIASGFFTDYLNPLHWAGYFSLGILIKKYRLDIKLRKQKYTLASASVLAILSAIILYCNKIFTYFHIVTMVFCLSSLVIIAAAAYRISDCSAAKQIEKIGLYSYCIYLLHLQIVQGCMSIVPDCAVKLLISPFICLGIMLILISFGLLICQNLPFGNKIKAMVGL
ncbi:MAG: acyltransferase [Ruminococcaceae bacterium]|nr:acyltransferase [Oscillospiraceae bacterium]